MSKVMIHPASYDDVSGAVRHAFKLFPIRITGKKVLIKPNVLRSSEAEEGIVTHPAVLKAVIEKSRGNETGFAHSGGQPGSFQLWGK